EERGDVVVVDEEEYVGLFLGQPFLDRLVAGEDGRPHRVLVLLRVERETDGGGVRGGDAANNRGHELLRRTRRPEYPDGRSALAREGRNFRVPGAHWRPDGKPESNRPLARVPGAGSLRQGERRVAPVPAAPARRHGAGGRAASG